MAAPKTSKVEAEYFSEYPQNPRAKEIGFSELWSSLVQLAHMLWRKRRFMRLSVCAGLLLGVFAALLIPSTYESTVQLMPPDSQPNSGLSMMAAVAGNASGLGSVASELLGAKNTGDQFVGILHSRTAADEIVQHFNLKKVYNCRLQEDARKQLTRNTHVSIDRKTGIITIGVSDRSPGRAADIARGYVDELDHLVTTLSTSAAHRERLFLEERLRSVKQDLDQAAEDFSQFASKNSAIDITEQGKAMVQSAATLQGELMAAQSELKGLEQIYSANNVRVRSVQARIIELEQQLRKLGGIADGKSHSSGGELYPSIRELPILGVTYSDLYRRTKIQEAVYESLTKEYELAKVEEAKETPSVKVLDDANVPERKSFPPRTLISLFGVFFGFLLGAGVVFLQARWNQMSPDHPSKAFFEEVAHSLRAKMPWSPPNGSRVHALSHWLWSEVSRKKLSKSPLDIAPSDN